MNRSTLKPKHQPRQREPEEFAMFQARPRSAAPSLCERLGGEATRVAEPLRLGRPKDTPHYSEAWRRAVASLPCVRCGIEGRTQCAHANHRGKGMSIKAPDCWTFPLCVECHREFDKGKNYTKQQRRELADEWIINTIMELTRRGLVRA